MKKLFALVLALVVLFTCCSAFAVTHYGSDSTSTINTEEGAFFLLNNTGNVVGAIRLDEFTSNIKNGNSPVALNVGYKTVSDILAEGKLLRCKNLKAVTLSDDKSSITTGESYVVATWEIKNQAVIDSLGIKTLSELVENTKFALTINGKDLAGHRFLDKDAGSEVARIYVGKSSYIRVRYADWDDGIANNNVLCFRAGAKPYTGSNSNSQATATPAPQQPTVTPVPQQPVVTPVPQQPVVTPAPQQPSNTPNPQYQPVVTPPTVSGNNGSTNTGSSSSSSGNVPNPEYQNGTLPGNLGDFWN